MPVKHAFTSAVADGADATQVRPSNWNADHNAPPFALTLVATEFVFTNIPAAVTEVGAGAGVLRIRADLTYATEARVSVGVRAGFAANAGATLAVQYSTDQTTWNYLRATGSGPSAVIDVAGQVNVSSWVALDAGAKADVYLRIVTAGGDGVADPRIGTVTLQVR